MSLFWVAGRGSSDTLAECVIVFLITQLVFVFSFVCSPQELQAGRCTVVWALWQCTRIWTHNFQPSSTFEQVYYDLFVFWFLGTHFFVGHQSKARLCRNQLWKGCSFPKELRIYLITRCDGQLRGTDHNLLAPKSCQVVVVKENVKDVKDTEDEAARRLRSSFFQLWGTPRVKAKLGVGSMDFRCAC